MVGSFFCGAELPRFITHTSMVMLLKKTIVNTFLDIWPISVSNFVNKIYSKIIHERIKRLFSHVILVEYASFV